MNKKKKIIMIIILILIIVLAAFIAYKIYLLNAYKIDEIKIAEYEQVQRTININETVAIEKKNYEGDYIVYKNIKVANIFKNYELKEKSSDKYENGYVSYVNKKENSELIIRNENSIIVDLTKYESEYNSNQKISLKCSNQKIIEENNIKNDMELIAYLKNYQINNNTIFTSKNKICENHFSYENLTRMSIEKVIPFEGNIEGYISIAGNNIEINIFDKEQVYILGFNNMKELTIEQIYDLISIIVIE